MFWPLALIGLSVICAGVIIYGMSAIAREQPPRG